MEPTNFDFESSFIAFCRITGWTNSEISEINNDITLFASSLTTYIHQGLDTDLNLQYQDVVLNLSMLNDRTLDYLLNGDDSEIGDILWQSIYDGMALRYLIQCGNSIDCRYIESVDPHNGLNNSVFEAFVSNKLNVHFQSQNVTNAPNLIFKVENITVISGSSLAVYVMDDGLFDTLLDIALVLVVFNCCTAVCVLALHCKNRKRNGTKNESNSDDSSQPDQCISNCVGSMPGQLESRTNSVSGVSCMTTASIYDHAMEGTPDTNVVENTWAKAAGQDHDDLNRQISVSVPDVNYSDERVRESTEGGVDDGMCSVDI